MSTMLITGGHAGLGREAAKRLAANKFDLILAGRDLKKVEAAARELRQQYGVKVEAVLLDLGSLASVRAATETCRTLLNSEPANGLHGLLCNAGAQFQGPISYSVDGYEETFAINCLGHFLLVNLLLDQMADGGRVVFTASGTHDPATMDGKIVGVAADPDADALAYDGKDGHKPLSGGVRYATSKLCDILLAYELDRRLRRAGVNLTSIAFDPGLIPETGLARTSPMPVQWLLKTRPMKWVLKSIGVTMGSLDFSGDALAKLAADPAFADGSGKYYQSHNGQLIEAQSSKASYDQAKAAKLWADAARLVALEEDGLPRRAA